MTRYQSAFAVPSGFAVSANSKPAKSARRGDSAHRIGDTLVIAPVPTKPRPQRDIRDRAA